MLLAPVTLGHASLAPSGEPSDEVGVSSTHHRGAESHPDPKGDPLNPVPHPRRQR